MSDTPMKAIIGANNEVQYVPLTAEEIQQRELDAIAFATEQAERQAAEEAKAAAKASALAKLSAIAGLTEDEVAAL
jgi:protein tyrosine phosphatase (PTP) superfamily phosphohydrolase (DUF442 family)